MIVFDTNILVSSTLWGNSVAHKLLIKLIEEGIEIFTTIEILDEYQKVLGRDFNYNKEDIEDKIKGILDFVKIIMPFVSVDVIKDDPDDNKIIECAIASNSDYILSYDKHLLNLKEFKGIKIITPEEFLKDWLQ